jgi:hypothetical protein
MPALINYDPSGATFSPITPDQYQNLVELINKNSKASKVAISGNLGSCEVQGVDFEWAYSGPGVNSLHVAITAKHGFVTSHVPNATIFDELNKQFVSLV